MDKPYECITSFQYGIEVGNRQELVRCKNCKHRPIMPKDYTDGFDLIFPDKECPCKCEDGWYSWYPEDNWFCANGDRKEGR
jgi:hypothetical protein